MADIELVIKIPEDVFKRTMFYREFRDLNDCVTTIKALEKAVPLPKGHGNLIQREEAEAIFRNAKMALYKQSHTEQIKDLQTRELMLLNAEQFVHLIKPIIEADKTEIEPQESEEQAEYHGTEDMDGLYYCPICQQTTTVVKDGKCPKCGATMDELSTREQTENAISRQAVDEAIYDYSRSCDVNYAQIMEYIDKIPSVNPQPKTGHWKYAEQLQAEICSCCGCIKGNYFFSDIEVPIKFCPNCGTKMIEQ